jgi:hypothetical protein
MDLPKLTADRCGDLCRDDGVPVFFACGIGMALGAEIAKRCNAFPVMLAALRMLAGDPGLTAGANDVVAGALEAAGEDWRLAECLNGRR